MKTSTPRPDLERALRPLKDFQRKTVDYVYRRLYEDPDCVKRFLIADEVGLGKTLVARGVVAKAVDRLWDEVERIDVVYICANRDIARQNINRLNITGNRNIPLATRMTLLPRYAPNLTGNKINFISFTPGTTFNLRSSTGLAMERALIYQILREAWDFGDRTGPKNLLQCTADKDPWRNYYLPRQLAEKPNEQLSTRFVENLKHHGIRKQFEELADRFAYYRQDPPVEDKKDRNRMVGELRRILAESCVDALEPDIVILDEFQRFKHLLDEENEAARLARAVFDHGDCRVILLSATPYKMYTMYHEQEGSAGDNHYEDFLRTTTFLFNAPAEETQFEEELRRYRTALLSLRPNDGQLLHAAKQATESSLRRVMVRTERLASTVDRSGMIVESLTKAAPVEPLDLNAFAALDRIAGQLKAGDTTEYWKSAPYLFNVMDRSGYKIKETLVSELERAELEPDLRLAIRQAREAVLHWSAVSGYRRLPMPNPRMRTLLENKVENGAWKLLWVPAACPYYRPERGPYADPGLQGFTKSLVFSSWLVVPKAIAMFASHDAERRMVRSSDQQSNYLTLRRHRRPLLNFTFAPGSKAGTKRAAGMSVFPLVYPSLTPATEIDPVEITAGLARDGVLPSQNEVEHTACERIRTLLEPVLAKHRETGGAADERWYWAALALLDRRRFRRPGWRWLKADESACRERDQESYLWPKMVRSSDRSGNRFGEHVEIFLRYFRKPRRLGRVPDDLLDVLTKTALASPATVALRTLLRQYPGADVDASKWLLPSAARIAMGFRTLFNLPESITLLRGLYRSEDTRYWESVLDYSTTGNLQAVMDEYVHTVRESLGLVDVDPDKAFREIAAEVHKAVSIRTVSLEYDEIKLRASERLKRRSMRCRYALRFGDARGEEEAAETRSDQVWSAFNSPFRPFILATTSIGQEGLDFHQYCNEVYHWNLPSNPIDLEQREGRVHRYKGHAIRRNVARKYPLHFLQQSDPIARLADVWQILFQQAKNDRNPQYDDLVPFWIYQLEDGQQVNRCIPLLPLSREHEQLEYLRRTIVACRMVLGQPRQEDLVRYLQQRFETDLDPDTVLQYRINLAPPERIFADHQSDGLPNLLHGSETTP